MADADSPYLSTFAQRAKMILYNGNSDQGMATEVIADWYERMIAATGEPGREAVRFFAVPGMLHCGGGEATDQFEMLGSIMAWVEQGRAPDRILVTSGSMPVFRGRCVPIPRWPATKVGTRPTPPASSAPRDEVSAAPNSGTQR
jgi:feruloyl esterase